MLIVSNFRDYYDTASIYGADKTCVYLRSEKVTGFSASAWGYKPSLTLEDGSKISIKRVPSQEEFDYNRAFYTFSKWVVGFCGTFYPVVKVDRERNLGSPISPSTENTEHFFYSKEDLQQYMADEEIEGEHRSRYYYRDDYSVKNEQSLSTFFDQTHWLGLSEIFHSFKVPVFVLGENSPGQRPRQDNVVLNPCLKKLGFMKVKDPQTAFQEIYMFLSGVIGMPEKPMIEVSDKVKAAAKGHDGPWSFRKPPGKRGKNRWR